jgi:hypothetical protein
LPGNQYATWCTYYGDGNIYSFEEGRVVFGFRNEPQPKTLMYGLVRLPEFVVYDPDFAIS